MDTALEMACASASWNVKQPSLRENFSPKPQPNREMIYCS